MGEGGIIKDEAHGGAIKGAIPPDEKMEKRSGEELKELLVCNLIEEL